LRGKETKGFGGKFQQAMCSVLLLSPKVHNFDHHLPDHSKITQNMRSITLLLLFCLFFSCQNPPAETRADRIAKGVCDCAAPLLDLNKKATADKDSIDFEAIQTAFMEARKCIVNQHMKPEDMPEVQKALLVKCPELGSETELLGELLGK
jgi:hypothetical protein